MWSMKEDAGMAVFQVFRGSEIRALVLDDRALAQRIVDLMNAEEPSPVDPNDWS